MRSNNIFAGVGEPAPAKVRISMEEEIQLNTELAEDLVQIENVGSGIDATEEVVHALEQLRLVMEATPQPSKPESALQKIAGAALTAGSLLSLEDINTAMESERGQNILTRIYKYIREAIARLWRAIKAFFGKSEKVVEAQSNRVEDVKKKVEEVGEVGRMELVVPSSFLVTKDTNLTAVRETLGKTLTAFGDVAKVSKYVIEITKAVNTSVKSGLQEFIKSNDKKNSYSVKAVGIQIPNVGVKKGSRALKNANGQVVDYFLAVPGTGKGLLYSTLSFSAGKVEDLGGLIDEIGEIDPPTWVEDDEASEGSENTYKVALTGSDDLLKTIEMASDILEKVRGIENAATGALSNETKLADELLGKQANHANNPDHAIARLTAMNLRVSERSIQAATKNLARLNTMGLEINNKLIAICKRAVEQSEDGKSSTTSKPEAKK